MNNEAVAKLRFGTKPALSPLDSFSSQIAYSQSSMSICEEKEPTAKSSNLASKASFAIASNIILCGFKSSGKTTLGKKMAEERGLHFIDTDDLIAKNNREFYLQVGLEAFRALEKKVIAALEGFQNTIIATGGGAVLDPDNVAVLKKMGTLIYLRVPKDELKRRLLIDPLPAILDPSDPEGSFEQMYHARVGIYESVADEIVDI